MRRQMIKNEKITGKLNEKGITLIALVVTIIIMLVLASITIGMAAFGNNPMFAHAKNAKAVQDQVNVLEQLEIYKQEVSVDCQGYCKISDFLTYICPSRGEKKVNITSKQDIDEHNTYFTIDNKYVYSVTELDGELYLTYQGEPGEKGPVLESVDYAASASKIAVQPKGKRLITGNTKYKYYITSDKNAGYGSAKKETSENVYVFTSLTANKTYYIKIEVTTPDGTSAIETELKTLN